MTYADLKYGDRTSLQYFNLLSTLILNNQIPIQALIFDKDAKRKTLIILRASPSGGISTKQLTTRNENMETLESNLNRDFPNLNINYISSEDVTSIINRLKET